MSGTAQLKRFLLRRPGLVRFAVIAALLNTAMSTLERRGKRR